MIIKREYVTFDYLIRSNDPGGKLFIECVQESFSEDGKKRQDEIIALLSPYCLFQREMSWAMSSIGKLIDGFKKLDKEKPFDNGCTLEDVNDVDIIWKDETSITLHLMHRKHGNECIVKVVKLRSK